MTFNLTYREYNQAVDCMGKIKPAETNALAGLHSGAKGGRTPDLLTASQTRYQLRYSPISL